MTVRPLSIYKLKALLTSKVSICLLLLGYVLLPVPCHGEVFFGISIPDSVLEQKVAAEIAGNPIFSFKDVGHASLMEGTPRHVFNHSDDFLYCIILLLFLGLLKQSNPVYLKNVFRAFGNRALSNRQLKVQLQQNYLQGLLLDLFFCFSAALFLYQAARYVHLDSWMHPYSSLTVIAGLAFSLAVIYLVRFLSLKLAGWVFRIPDVLGYYSFNIFLLNRVLGILLLPFTILLSFGTGFWVEVTFLIAILVVLALYVFRFIRSRQVFKHSLRFSVFHFILYLCAAEVLPLAFLIKLVGSQLT